MGAEAAHTGDMTNEWTVVQHCSSLPEAEFLKSVLEAEGLDARIPDEYTVGVNPGLINALGGIRLVVPVDDAGKAEEILAASKMP